MHGSENSQALRGNGEKYVRFLNRLVLDHEHDTTRLLECLGRGDRREARNIAHNLKGVSANMSATALAQAAKDMDDELRDEEREIEAGHLRLLVSAVEQEMAWLKSALRCAAAP